MFLTSERAARALFLTTLALCACTTHTQSRLALRARIVMTCGCWAWLAAPHAVGQGAKMFETRSRGQQGRIARASVLQRHDRADTDWVEGVSGLQPSQVSPPCPRAAAALREESWVRVAQRGRHTHYIPKSQFGVRPLRAGISATRAFVVIKHDAHKQGGEWLSGVGQQ